jgi:hypothetical protein
MTVFQDADVAILMADYVATDAAGKLNAIGVGFNMMLPQPGGVTPPFGLAVTCNVPVRHVGTQYTLGVELHDATRGRIVQVPSDPMGGTQAVRAQQLVAVDTPVIPPGFARPEGLWVQHIMSLMFPAGLPLEAGTYEWRVQIDSQYMTRRRRTFHVMGPDPGVIVGGPANAPNIPGVVTYGVITEPEADTPGEPEQS